MTHRNHKPGLSELDKMMVRHGYPFDPANRFEPLELDPEIVGGFRNLAIRVGGTIRRFGEWIEQRFSEGRTA